MRESECQDDESATDHDPDGEENAIARGRGRGFHLDSAYRICAARLVPIVPGHTEKITRQVALGADWVACP